MASVVPVWLPEWQSLILFFPQPCSRSPISESGLKPSRDE